MAKRTSLRWMISLLIALSFLFGCGGKGKEIKKVEGDPETLYKQGLARFNKRDYAEALKKFEEFKSNFPDSPPYTLWVELKIGDCHFLKKEYVEAIAAYEEFKKIHPGHDEIPYVQYQIGMSYFNQMHTLDRDQTATRKALSNFEYLVANYPPSLFTEKAKEKIGICIKRLADHEFYIGNFYYKDEKYQAAASRFEGLLVKYPKNPGEDKTLYLLGRSYLELEQWEKAKAALERIISEYPNSSHTKEAKMILNQGLSGTKGSSKKTKMKESKKKGEIAEREPGGFALVRFEEEGKKFVSLEEDKRIGLKKEVSRERVSPEATESIHKDPTRPLPPLLDTKPEEPIQIKEPMKEDQGQTPPPPPSAQTTLDFEIKSDDGEKVAALPGPVTSPDEKKEAKILDTTQPIEITSDQVEAYRKENIILFKGNVIARQKDIVIYADSIEALIIEDGKGIERVIAGGNVKIQQGLRVAHCQKAIFYNVDQKVVLTGDPRVVEGDSLVSGEEIIFDIEKNRVEVKGGTSRRGKARIDPGKAIESLK